MRGYVEGLLESDSFASRGCFDVAKARKAFRTFCRGGHDNSFFVWQWINVEEWFRIFIDGDPVTQRYALCPEVAATDRPARPAAQQATALSGTAR